MNQSSLEVRVRATRPPFAGADLSPRLSLVLPDRFLKKQERTLIWTAPLVTGGGAVYKVYLQRNFWSHFLGFFWSLCARREYENLLLLEERGVPCTEPLLWGLGRSPIHGRFEILVTRELPEALSLRDGVRETGRLPSLDLILRASGLVRQMHACGMYHGALGWKNLLASPSPGGEIRIHIADLARSLRFNRDIFGSRMARLDLLHFCHHLAPRMGVEACRSFLKEYGLDDRSVADCIEALDGFRTENNMRLRLLRLEFLSRAFLSRLRPGSADGPPASPVQRD